MPRRARVLAKDQLQTLYADAGLSIAAVAHHTGTNSEAVRRSLREYGIAVRASGQFRHL